jgi:hypothetical protein
MAIVNPIVSTAEVQTVTVDATGGTFTVTWNGATTGAVAFNASGATFSAAMDTVTDRSGECVVTGGPGAAGGGTPYTLTWSADKGNVPAPTTDVTSLTGGAGTAAVATVTPGVSRLADPYLSDGAHTAPTHPTPDQGDWQWCMMEVAAWMADEAWTDDPANVSPVIAQLCKALNDAMPDEARQDLKDYLVVAPDGVIDTVSPGADETTRVYLSTNWLIRTYVPLWLDLAGLTEEADELQALPAIASGTMDAEETEAVLSMAGTVARAVADYNWSDQDWVTLPGDGRVDFPIAGDYFEHLWPDLTTDHDFERLELAKRCSRGAGFDSLGADAGQAAWDGARRMARAAAWDTSSVVAAAMWDSTRAAPTPWLAVTGGVTDEDTVALAAWTCARDAAFAACTQGALARVTHDIYEVRFAAWLAWLEAEDEAGYPAAAAYAAAAEAAATILSPVTTTVTASALSLLDAMCAV